ncbi:MAG: glycerophosphodiester phosphodiesterase family protein, partial [Flavobacteriaceae bacterium]|nr:glycerophosphodiester phosphodiesterase family protein [Flavobacteriaceae bacterium]
MKIYAHRGLHNVYTENTLEAVNAAFELPIDGVEIDVRCTADEHAILMHDDQLDRVTNAQGVIERFTLMELYKIKTRCGQSIATLDEVLQHLPKEQLLNIECKTLEATKVSIALLLNRKQNNLLISSFIPEALAFVAQQMPSVETALIADEDFEQNLEHAIRLNCKALHFCGSKLIEQNILDAKAAKLRLVAWTVNDAVLAQKLYA